MFKKKTTYTLAIVTLLLSYFINRLSRQSISTSNTTEVNIPKDNSGSSRINSHTDSTAKNNSNKGTQPFEFEILPRNTHKDVEKELMHGELLYASNCLTCGAEAVKFQNKLLNPINLPQLALESEDLENLHNSYNYNVYNGTNLFSSNISAGYITKTTLTFANQNTQIKIDIPHGGFKAINGGLNGPNTSKLNTFVLSPKVFKDLMSTKTGLRILRENRLSIPFSFVKLLFSNDGKIKPFSLGISIDNCGYQSDSNFDKIDFPPPDLSMLKIDDFKEMYLFDVFRDDTCTHGKSVLEVVKQVLQKNNVSFALSKIHPIPINYYANYRNKEIGDSIIESYKKEYPGDETHGNPIEINRFLSHFGSDEFTPISYLFCIYRLSNNPQTDIISSSYGLETTENFQNLVFSNDTDSTNYLAAAGNEDSSTVEEYYERRSSTHKELAGIVEPQFTYATQRPYFGSLIVGSQIKENVSQGRYSKNGISVQILGKGVGWGDSAYTSCLKPKQFGTSLATPEVAAKLFIAKAYLRKFGIHINAIEARKRTILATNLAGIFVGRYASAGPLNLTKLIQVSRGYVVDNTDSIIPISDFSSASYIHSPKEIDQLLKLSLSEGKKLIRGIYSEGGNFYVFRNGGDEKWEAYKAPEEFYLSITINGIRQEFMSLNSFLSSYKQIVLLN